VNIAIDLRQLSKPADSEGDVGVDVDEDAGALLPTEAASVDMVGE
jgi:hypothetical protein